MIDKTNKAALNKLIMQYGDQIVNYKYKAWKESYLDKPPRGAFCTGITRYRKCYKVTHIVLKDGRIIPVEPSLGCLSILISVLFVLTILLFL